MRAFLAGGMSFADLATQPARGAQPVGVHAILACVSSLHQACSRMLDDVPAAMSRTFSEASSPAVLCTTPQTLSVARTLTLPGGVSYSCCTVADSVPRGVARSVVLVRTSNTCTNGDLAREALVLHGGGGDAIVDAQFYRGARLVLLVRDMQGACRLYSFSTAELEYLHLAGSNIVAECTAQRTTSLSDSGECMLQLPGLDACAPLALSSKRGLACVFVDQARGVVIDLEADVDDDD